MLQFNDVFAPPYLDEVCRSLACRAVFRSFCVLQISLIVTKSKSLSFDFVQLLDEFVESCRRLSATACFLDHRNCDRVVGFLLLRLCVFCVVVLCRAD